MELFAQATRSKLRFTPPQDSKLNGVLNTEDLWSLDLVVLNKIAVELHNAIAANQISFLKSAQRKEDVRLRVSLDVVKYIIDTKEKEMDNSIQAAKRAAERDQLLQLRYHKELEERSKLSLEEIDQRLAELD